MAPSANSTATHAKTAKKSSGKLQIPVDWKETSAESQTKVAIIGNPFPKENPSKAKRRASRSRHEIKRRAKKSLHSKPVKAKGKGKAKAKPGLVAKTEATKRKRVHRVVRGKPKPGHIVGHSQRRRKGEILCHNHVLHTATTANGVHGFHWFTVCAPAGWDPASDEWEVCPCGWRHELGKHYAKADHVQWWREQIKERGSLEAGYREVRKRQSEYRDRDVG